MTEAEGAPVSELLARIDYILELDKDAECEEVKLPPDVRADLIEASHAVWQMCTRKQQLAQKNLEVFSLWRKLRGNRDFQMKLVDEKGKPLENPIRRTKNVPEKNAQQLADEAAAAAEQVEPGPGPDKPTRKRKASTNGTSSNGQVDGAASEVDPKDGTQGELVTNPPPAGGHSQSANGLDWTIGATIPAGVKMGILSEAQNGLTRAKVIAKVVKDTSHTPEEVKAWFGQLEKLGHLVANIAGNTYQVVVDPSKAVPHLVALAYEKALELGMSKEAAVQAIAQQHFPTAPAMAEVLWDDLVNAGTIAQCGVNWIWASQTESKVA